MQLNKDGTINKFDKGRAKVRNHILDSSYKVISETLISNISMLSLAEAAKVSRQTLYKYFDSIDDIIFALKKKLDEELLDDVIPVFGEEGVNGCEKCLAAIQKLFDLTHEDPKKFIFLSRFGTSPTAREVSSFYEALFAKTVGAEQVILKGQRDGSIRKDLDPQVTAFSLVNTSVGIALRLVVSKPQIDYADHNLSSRDVEAAYIDGVRRYIAA